MILQFFINFIAARCHSMTFFCHIMTLLYYIMTFYTQRCDIISTSSFVPMHSDCFFFQQLYACLFPLFMSFFFSVCSSQLYPLATILKYCILAIFLLCFIFSLGQDSGCDYRCHTFFFFFIFRVIVDGYLSDSWENPSDICNF